MVEATDQPTIGPQQPTEKSTPSPIRITFVNVQCLRSKINLVERFIEENKPSVLCLVEHWLVDEESEFYNELGGLKLASMFCRQNSIHGGVGSYVGSELSKVEPIDLSAYNVEFDLELVGIRIGLCSDGIEQPILVLTIYRSNGGMFENFLNKLSGCLEYLSRRYNGYKILIGGDFNLWLNHDTPQAKQTTDLLRTFGFFWASLEPTRGANCLDSVATNCDTWNISTTVVNPLIADHLAVVLELRLSPPTVSNSTDFTWIFNYNLEVRKVDSELFPYLSSLLTQINWELLFSEEAACGSKAFEVFFSKFKAIFDTVFPMKQYRYSKSNRPITSKPKGKNKKCGPIVDFSSNKQLQTLKSWVLLLHDLYKNATSREDRDGHYKLYLQTKAQYRQCLDQAKREANVKFIEGASNSCKAAWGLIKNNYRQPKVFECPTSPDQFNQFFVNAVKEIVVDMPTTSDIAANRVNNLMNGKAVRWSLWEEVTPETIAKIVGGFKSSSCTDVYGMSVMVLKSCILSIALPLAFLVNLCLSQGIFPANLKVAKTIPIYKKGDPSLPKSYRPISIIPVIAKVFETVMYQQLITYFERNELLSSAQHGFRKNKSTVTAVRTLIEGIQEAFEEEESVLLTLLDLSKAFDCVSHEILLTKLRNYGIDGAVYDVFQSYLQNRQQVVSIQGATSDVVAVEYGVPQGSALGPVLFLILINDFTVSCKSLLYADDTTLATRGSDMMTLSVGAAYNLEEAKEWFRLNNLQLNQDKTQNLLCSLWSRAEAEGYEEAVKLLGITIDRKLCWNKHVDEVCKKLTRVNFLLRKLSALVTPEYLVLAYFGLFHCHINYGLVLWGHSSSTARVLIQQKTAMRILTGSGHLDHCRTLFQQLGVLTIHSQYILNCLLTLKTDPPAEIAKRDQICGYQLRNSKNLDVPRCRLKKTQDSFPNIAYKMYNKLPLSFRELKFSLFKNKLKTWLQKKSFYKIEEYFNASFADLTL